MKVIGIIPARAGSQRVPNKNIKKFLGKPLIAWSILSAKKSKYLDRIIVSTDSPKIRNVAQKYGAEVPFLRPANLATSKIGLELTFRHTYEWLLKNENYKADAIVILMATSPTRQSFHIDEAIKMFIKTKADSVVCVNETPANHTPYWTLTRSKKGKVTLWGGIPLKKIHTRRQDFPQTCYARNDLVYVINPKNLYDKERPNYYGNKVELYIIPNPEKYEADINTPGEWKEAERKMKHLMR